jgi:CBS domain-containing protein
MSLARFKRPLATAEANETAEHAACTMRDQGVGCLVITERGRPLGIVTDRDLVVRLVAEGLDASLPVGEFTTYDPLTVNVRDSIETVSACMRTHGVRRIPIVDDDGSAVGIVTADDLLMLLGRGLADVCESIENRSDATDSR